MSRRFGPPPKPTALKVLEGQKYGLNKHEPKPKKHIGEQPPEWLNGIARIEWLRMKPQLEELGLLTDVDATAFEAYCDSYATLVECRIQLELDGLTVESETGVVKSHPLLAVKSQAAASVRHFCQEFGLTPSARTRMEVKPLTEEKDSPDNKMAKLLG